MNPLSAKTAQRALADSALALLAACVAITMFLPPLAAATLASLPRPDAPRSRLRRRAGRAGGGRSVHRLHLPAAFHVGAGHGLCRVGAGGGGAAAGAGHRVEGEHPHHQRCAGRVLAFIEGA